MEILTAAQMNAIDRDSGERGVPVRVLMENAGEAVARFCHEQYPGFLWVVVLAAKATTAAMELVAARLLAEIQIPVRLVLLGSMEEARGRSCVCVCPCEGDGRSRVRRSEG